AAAEIPVAQVSTPVLPGSGQVYEVWRCDTPATSGQRQRVRFRSNSDMLFGCIAVTEAPACHLPAGGGPQHSALHQATTQAYRQICATLAAEGYPHLLRVWNYLPDINRDSHGTERYRQFNSARQQVLRECGRALTGNVPAASALGAASDSPLVVYFLAGRTAPTFLENPRQVSAYHYPRQYGSHSPVFSRATLLRQSGGPALFISLPPPLGGATSLRSGHTAPPRRHSRAPIPAP